MILCVECLGWLVLVGCSVWLTRVMSIFMTELECVFIKDIAERDVKPILVEALFSLCIDDIKKRDEPKDVAVILGSTFIVGDISRIDATKITLHNDYDRFTSSSWKLNDEFRTFTLHSSFQCDHIAVVARIIHFLLH